MCDSGSNSLDRRGETKEKNDINQPPFLEEKVNFFFFFEKCGVPHGDEIGVKEGMVQSSKGVHTPLTLQASNERERFSHLLTIFNIFLPSLPA